MTTPGEDRKTELPAATASHTTMHSWEVMAQQFPDKGFPGITATVEHPRDFPEVSVDALQYRALDGSIIGLLIRYPLVAGFERDGNVNVWVRPDRQREGIATSLLKEALRRWSNIDLMNQDYTPAGRAVAARLTE
jgi:GNAT superfamily N-acetyltransferase